MIIFDGVATARDKELQVAREVDELKKLGKSLKIAAILFLEDAGSRLYTQLKQQAAERVGIAYHVYEFSMNAPVVKVVQCLEELSADSSITGIIVQKPWRARWSEVTHEEPKNFSLWWQQIVSSIHEAKDVDGLHPQTLQYIREGSWQEHQRVLPATVMAVLSILKQFDFLKQEKKYVIVGKSDLLGTPLFYELQRLGIVAELIGSKELEERKIQQRFLLDADVVVSATGKRHLITGELLKSGVAVIDVGEPKPDVEMASVAGKASFLTPVPGGVGPMTVVSLLQNCVELGKYQIE